MYSVHLLTCLDTYVLFNVNNNNHDVDDDDDDDIIKLYSGLHKPAVSMTVIVCGRTLRVDIDYCVVLFAASDYSLSLAIHTGIAAKSLRAPSAFLEPRTAEHSAQVLRVFYCRYNFCVSWSVTVFGQMSLKLV